MSGAFFCAIIFSERFLGLIVLHNKDEKNGCCMMSLYQSWCLYFMFFDICIIIYHRLFFGVSICLFLYFGCKLILLIFYG